MTPSTSIPRTATSGSPMPTARRRPSSRAGWAWPNGRATARVSSTSRRPPGRRRTLQI
jgi:hypothetical protein